MVELTELQKSVIKVKTLSKYVLEIGQARSFLLTYLVSVSYCYSESEHGP